MGEGRSRRLLDLRAVLVSEPWSDQPIADALSALYQDHLGRSARSAELENWSQSIRRGATFEHVRSTLLREARS